MNPCPIAKWRKHRPDALALSDLTYQELDAIVEKASRQLAVAPFPAHSTPEAIALFFAALRLGKTAYPYNPKSPPPPQIPEMTDAATLIATSSASKIACHTFAAHVRSAEMATLALHITESSRICLNLPLFHVSGIATLFRCFIAGAQLVLPNEMETATHISMVPTQLYRLLRNEISLPHCSCILVGGAPLSDSLKEEALTRNLPLYTSYGMTETASMVVCNGKPLPGVEIKIAPDREILIKSPTLLTHYLGEPKIQGWFATKDLGALSPDGTLQILGRKDRQFITGGENIQPEEIERTLTCLDGVIGAHVFSTEDPEFGQKMMARIYIEKPLVNQNIIAELKKILPPFKIPKEIETILGAPPAKVSLEAASTLSS